jgi:hypothetical protein
MKPEASAFTWDVVFPQRDPALARSVSQTIAIYSEMAEFRGRVLYDGGRRPSFLSNDGGFDDADPLDPSSYHIIIRASGTLVACCRLIPLEADRQGVHHAALGGAQFEALLRKRGIREKECLVGGRWLVAHRFRSTMLGPRLITAAWAVGRRLDRRYLFAATGTKDGQAVLLERLGGCIVSEIAPIPSDVYDDVTTTVVLDLPSPPRHVQRRLPQMEARLFRAYTRAA